MEKEMNEKKKQKEKTKSITKKAKKMRSIVMMSLLCVLLLSAATYAWFTLSNTAKIANLTMTVGNVTGLQIAKDTGTGAKPSDTDWKSSINGGTIKGKLLPATTTDGEKFLQPDYNDNGEVTGTSKNGAMLSLDSDENATGHYIMYTFWLKSLGEDVDVKLKAGTGVAGGLEDSDTNTSLTGTYVFSKGASDGIPGSASIRMSFVSTETDDSGNTVKTIAVYEPNSDISESKDEGSSSRAKDSRTDNEKNLTVKSSITQTNTGTINVNSESEYSNVVKLKAGVAKKITLYIWIEGTDPQCSNEIALKNIQAQLLFTTDENPNSTSTYND